ncbi:response regulator [Saccharibacillus alkalitolerans]|uniref:Response regulator n=1 Tax=Saccharibacillus alkalitolerans TaxID=2705290 RepID=A0ABX0F2H6_9BACL|nr:response regulator [Saccharibacillus alkalitolerans]NGZ75186.1 response regulator [Saccharibacillus alkalitolerans]
MVKDAMCVLYIEDDRSSMLLMRHIFKKKLPRLTLLEAWNVEEGLALARLHRPKLILMDIQLPDMDGYEGVAGLRSDPNTTSIPVWAVSASALDDDVKQGLEAGFQKYLKKPLGMGSFVRLVEEALEPETAEK